MSTPRQTCTEFGEPRGPPRIRVMHLRNASEEGPPVHRTQWFAPSPYLHCLWMPIQETQPRGLPPALTADLSKPRFSVPAPPPYRYGRTLHPTKGCARGRMRQARIPEGGNPRRRKVGDPFRFKVQLDYFSPQHPRTLYNGIVPTTQTDSN